MALGNTMVILDFSKTLFSSIQPILDEFNGDARCAIVPYIEDDVSIIEKIMNAVKSKKTVFLVDAIGTAKSQFRGFKSVAIGRYESASYVKQSLQKYLTTEVA